MQYSVTTNAMNLHSVNTWNGLNWVVPAIHQTKFMYKVLSDDRLVSNWFTKAGLCHYNL